MRLYRLIGLEIMALQEEYAEILKKIDKYQDILEHPASMKRVKKKDLEKIKKNYGFDRKTELTNAKAAVVKALPIEEKEVVFVMDRFGYSKILDKNTYERNEETVLKEYRHIVHCMNTDKICVFTDTGVMHQKKYRIFRQDGSEIKELLLIISETMIAGMNIFFSSFQIEH